MTSGEVEARVARGRKKSSYGAAVRFTAVYLVVAGLWILLSDSLVAVFPDAIEARLQTMKGLAFVAVTGFVLFILVARWGTRVGREVRHAESVERLLEQVVYTVPVGVLLVSDEGLITFLNPSARALLGVSSVEAVGWRFDELGIFETDGIATDVTGLLRRGATDGLRIRPAEGGAARTVLARSAEVDVNAPESGWVVAVADVTDAQEARDRSARLVKGYQYLSQAAIAMTRSGSHRGLLEAVARLAVDLGGFTAAWVLHEEITGHNEPETAFFGERGKACADVAHIASAYAPGGELLGRLVGGEILVSNDLAHDPRNLWYSCAEPEGWASSAELALDVPGERAVVLALFADTPGFFDAGQVELLQSVRSSLGFALNRLALDRQRLDAEEALERSEARYRTLFEKNPQAMWVFDLKTFEFLAVNDAAVAKYGYTREEMMSMKATEIRPREEVPRLVEHLSHVREGYDDAGIWTHVDKSGREFAAHVFTHVVSWEGRRAVLAMVTEVAHVE